MASQAGLRIYGDQQKRELVGVYSAPDGGFIIGANYIANSNKEILLSKYDAQLNLEWEQHLGGNLDNKLFKVFFDREDNIIVGGLSYGFGKDTSPPNEHKWWSWSIFKLDENGQTIWEYSEGASGASVRSGLDEYISDIIQDEAGNYVIVGEMFNTVRTSPTTFFLSGGNIHSHILKLSEDGQRDGTFYFPRNYAGKIDAVFEIDNSYLVLNYWQRDSDTLAVYKAGKIFNVRFEGFDPFYREHETEWPMGNQFDNNQKARFKQEDETGLSTNHVLSDRAYRFTYSLADEEITSKKIVLDFGPITRAFKLIDERIAFLTQSKEVYITNANFEPQTHFNLNWQIQSFCSLKDGNHIGIIEKDNLIYLLHLDESGAIKNDEEI